ncbi:helix-turn-helix domain-containing protein [Providencia rettgeri]|uniref:winged helix-turn-helix domain-containing protein n=1 Tax=Providencia rettgeri TaxID=587 RepID=UPI0025A7F179|nr:helix-turn-helix domain-containing protein [Providencia rettgeri]ELR5221214.1 helix-turn-helix domain-containing protein [Providencia rettgeri]MDX7322068.1 helix-turn-helix domain-containing protein [Providencia rettgeri]
MNYLINNHINYDSHQGLLYTDDINDALKLTTTLNRLLLVLVQNNHDIVDRETILRRVWEEHNQVVSDNNLNSSVSVLRRHLSSFSDDEIITTVPKVGFKFSAGLKIENGREEINDNSDELLFTTDLEITPSSEMLEGTQTQAAGNKKNYMLNNRYVEISLIGLIIFCLLYLFKSYFFASRTEYPEVGRIDQCSIRYINSYHKPDTTTISFETIQNEPTKLDIDCKKSATVFYYNVGIIANDKNLYDNFLFLSYCPTVPKDNTTVSCENFYVR